jgi:DNA-binding CsgD family transcriptional regulator
LLRGADAFWAAGAPARANTMLTDAAQDCDDPRVLGAIRHLQGHITLQSVSLAAAHEMLVREGLALAELDPAEAAFMIGEAGEAMICLGEFEKAVATARLGVPLAAGEGGMGEFFIAAVLGCGLIGIGDLAEGRRQLRRSFEILEENAELRENPRAMGWRIMPPAWLDEYEEALRMACQADEHARKHGALGDLVYTLFPKAGYEFLLGSWQQAYADAEESVALALDAGQHIMAMFAIHDLAELHAACGRDDACRDVVAEGVRVADGLGGMHEWPAFALGLLELGRGRPADAIGQGQHRAIMAVFDLAEAYVLAGDLSAASAVADAVEANYAGRPWELAGLARIRGMLAERDTYDAAFASSRTQLEQLGMRFESARTDLCWGERLRRDGRRKDSREHLRAALETFEELGARPWAERARTELRASGESIRRASHDRDYLTARELQVVLQAVDGKTNREVGAALFLSPKTVDIHLTRAYRKLGIHSRTELEGALARVGSARTTSA